MQSNHTCSCADTIHHCTMMNMCRFLRLSLGLYALLCIATHISADAYKSPTVDHAPGPGLIGRSLYHDAAFGLPLNAGVHGLTPDITKGVPLMAEHKPHSVRIDYAVVERATTSSPLVVSTAQPRFSWEIGRIAGERDVQQAAYRLRITQITPVATQDSLDYDSGIVRSSQSTHVQYNGPQLRANAAYHFALSYTLRDGRHSKWNAGEFRTGVVLRDDDSTRDTTPLMTRTSASAQWIGDIDGRANQFRFDFNISVSDLQETVSAEILLATAGYGELYVNGSAVDPTRKLDPSWTEYETYMLYVTYSVLPLLSSGPNTVGVWLGHSWYSAAQWMSPLSDHKPQYGSPRFSLTLQMNLKNGSMLVLTSSADSGQWLARVSPVMIDGIYSGEIVDARLSDPKWAAPLKNRTLSYHWHPVQQLENPTASLRPATIPPIRIIGLMTPISYTTWGTANQCVFDFGQHFSGWIRFSIKDVTDTRGIQIRVRYAEILAKGYSDTIYTASNRGAASTDTFVLSGVAGEIYEPRFTYHGARYVEVVGIPGGIANIEVVGVIVHSYAPQTGQLKLNNTILDQIQQNVVWSESTNLMSIPTACDQRDERTGFNGDIGLAVDGSFFNIEALPVHAKYLDDQETDQRSDGSYDITSPTNNYGPGGVSQPNWGIGFIRIIWAAYSHFQDLQLLARHYDSMTRWMEWLEAQYEANGLIHMYGWDGPTDWVPPPPNGKCNGSLTSSFGYLANMDVFINVSIVLNKTDAMKKWMPIYAARAKEFHNAFYVSESVGYANGLQTCNALALALPLAVPPQLRAAVAATLAASVAANDYRLTTGIVGTAQLFPMLSANGQHDVAMRMATGIKYPGYGYQFNNEWENSTSIWELWNADQANGDMNSRNLIMFSSIGSWFWRYCAGIQLDGDSAHVIRIEPLLPSPELNLSIHSMDASYVSLRGLIRVAWSRQQSDHSTGFDVLTAHITVPHNVQARVRLPHPHPTQQTQLIQLSEWEASEDTSKTQQNRLIRVQNVLMSTESIEPLHSLPSNGVQSARWLSQDRVLELHLSSGSFGFQLMFAHTPTTKTRLATLQHS